MYKERQIDRDTHRDKRDKERETHTCVRTHAHTQTHTHTHTRTARTRTHTHTHTRARARARGWGSGTDMHTRGNRLLAAGGCREGQTENISVRGTREQRELVCGRERERIVQVTGSLESNQDTIVC